MFPAERDKTRQIKTRPDKTRHDTIMIPSLLPTDHLLFELYVAAGLWENANNIPNVRQEIQQPGRKPDGWKGWTGRVGRCGRPRHYPTVFDTRGGSQSKQLPRRFRLAARCRHRSSGNTCVKLNYLPGSHRLLWNSSLLWRRV